MTWMSYRARWRWALGTAVLLALAGVVGWVLAGNLGGGPPPEAEVLVAPTVSPAVRATPRPRAT